MSGSTNKIALSIDLDDWYHSPLVSGADFSRYKSVNEFYDVWDKPFDYATEPTLLLLGLLNEYKIKATFFVIADMVERYPKLMRELARSGHEIAHHSLHHTVPFNTKSKEQVQTKDEWEAELVLAKNILENYFQRPVIGYRAPGAYFAPWMVPILKVHGFKYDSSIAFNSIYNKTSSQSRSNRTYPYYIDDETMGVDKNPDIDGLMELPWSNLKIGKTVLPAGGAFFFRALGYRYFKATIKQNLKQGDSMFYLHSIDLTNKKFPLQNFKHRPFYWINKGDTTIKRLKKILRTKGFNFTSCQEIYLKNKLC